MREESDRRFGVVFFDDSQQPGAGWAATAEEDARNIVPRRIAGSNELSSSTIWWTNISYEHFFRGTAEPWRNPNLRHDKYLVVSPSDVLKEWGHDPTKVEPDFVCSFCAQLFDRIMRIAGHLLCEHNPKKTLDTCFTGKTMREDMRTLLPTLEYPKLEAADTLKSGQAWEEFTATGARGPKGGKWVMLRRPRLSYALSMLQTPVPKGPYEFLTRGDLRSKTTDRVRYVRELSVPAMIEVGVNKIQQEVAPIYGFGAATDKDKRVTRSWIAAPEFEILSRIAEVDVRSLYQAGSYWAMVPSMPECARSFMSDKFSLNSWSAGVVAECLWRAVSLSESKETAGPSKDGEAKAQTSWQGLWIRAADKSEMFNMSMRLNELGYAVLSYGLGWVRCQVGEEEIPNLIKDGLMMGLIPQLSDVPENVFGDGSGIVWGGDARSKGLARLTVSKQVNLLWNLDKTPALPPEARAGYIQRLSERMAKAGK